MDKDGLIDLNANLRNDSEPIGVISSILSPAVVMSHISAQNLYALHKTGRLPDFGPFRHCYRITTPTFSPVVIL